MSYKRIGDCIRLVSNRNSNWAITNLLGVNIYKNFMPSVANTSGVDLSKYKIIQKGQFATNIMHVNRDEILPVALYLKDEPAIVSPAYMTFEVIDETELSPEFLMMEFQRHEFDRRAWTYCDSSVRGGLEWGRFCEIKIPIPDIEEQRKFVALYNGLLTNQKTYENSLADLQLICNSSMDKIKVIDNHQPLSGLICQLDTRNRDLSITNLLGVNINKYFMPSAANTWGVDLSKYKIIKKGEFATNIMHVNRDEILPVALYQNEEPAIVSPAYMTFKVIDENVILSEFLMMWLQRPEFDRRAWTYCDSSVRGGLEWGRLCEIEIPLPNLKIQEAIVTIYHTLETRKRINEQLKNTIKPLCPVLMRGVVENINEKSLA
jgi:type I restriction enzyme S subunit